MLNLLKTLTTQWSDSPAALQNKLEPVEIRNCWHQIEKIAYLLEWRSILQACTKLSANQQILKLKSNGDFYKLAILESVQSHLLNQVTELKTKEQPEMLALAQTRLAINFSQDIFAIDLGFYEVSLSKTFDLLKKMYAILIDIESYSKVVGYTNPEAVETHEAWKSAMLYIFNNISGQEYATKAESAVLRRDIVALYRDFEGQLFETIEMPEMVVRLQQDLN